MPQQIFVQIERWCSRLAKGSVLGIKQRSCKLLRAVNLSYNHCLWMINDQWVNEWYVLNVPPHQFFTALKFMHRRFLINFHTLRLSWISLSTYFPGESTDRPCLLEYAMTDTLMHLFHPKFVCVRGGASTPCCFALGLPQCAEWWGPCFWLSQRFEDETAIPVKINYYR